VLINTILSSAKSPFIFVCTCRPVTKDHPFIQLVDAIEKTNNVSEISLRGLGIDEVHGMVCDLLRIDRASDLSSEHCWPLSDFLWQITNGSEFGCVNVYQPSFTILIYAMTSHALKQIHCLFDSSSYHFWTEICYTLKKTKWFGICHGLRSQKLF
jgi:hypothetical protein